MSWSVRIFLARSKPRRAFWTSASDAEVGARGHHRCLRLLFARLQRWRRYARASGRGGRCRLPLAYTSAMRPTAATFTNFLGLISPEAGRRSRCRSRRATFWVRTAVLLRRLGDTEGDHPPRTNNRRPPGRGSASASTLPLPVTVVRLWSHRFVAQSTSNFPAPRKCSTAGTFGRWARRYMFLSGTTMLGYKPLITSGCGRRSRARPRRSRTTARACGSSRPAGAGYAVYRPRRDRSDRSGGGRRRPRDPRRHDAEADERLRRLPHPQDRAHHEVGAGHHPHQQGSGGRSVLGPGEGADYYVTRTPSLLELVRNILATEPGRTRSA